ncbi:MAG TPA: cytochrome c peroxidase [Burkholderiaceae bacterium]|jgi:cytochrome c peroxidase|nr:cytochrome c peroxidase [Burkholderiaceae bacterium]
MTRLTRFPSSAQAARLVFVATALVLAAGAGAQSSSEERAVRAAARADALSHAVRDPALLAQLRRPGEADKPKISLGREVFRDHNLSEPAGQACESCHRTNRAFTSKGAVSAGADPELFGFRNAPTITYAMYTPPLQKAAEDGATGYLGGQFRDGHAQTLQDQVAFPLTNPVEMGNPDLAAVVAKVSAASYADTFRQIYGDDVFSNQDTAVAAIEDAIATYERASEFRRFDSKWDAYWAGKATLTDAEERGRVVFTDPDHAACSGCHLVQPDKGAGHALLTDYGYDNIGIPRNPANPYYRMPAEINPEGHKFVDIGLQNVLGKQSTRGQFKSPSLRNVAVTGPWGHNGYFKTLRGLLDFYNTRDVKPRCADKFTSEADAEKQGCWPEPEVEKNENKIDLGNLKLTDQQIDDLLVFLGTFTDGYGEAAEASPR